LNKNQIYYCFAWGFPLLSLIIFLSAGGKLGGSMTSIFIFCWIIQSNAGFWEESSTDKFLDYLVWYVPIGIMGLIGLICIACVMYKIYQSSKAVNSGPSTVKKKQWHLHLRPTLFVLSFFLVFFWWFVWRVHYSMNSHELELGVSDFTNCFFNPFHTEVCESRPAGRLAPWAWFGLYFFMSVQGLLLLLVWGTQWENIALWLDCLNLRVMKDSSKPPSGNSHHSTGFSHNSRHDGEETELSTMGKSHGQLLDPRPTSSPQSIPDAHPSKLASLSSISLIDSPSKKNSPFDEGSGDPDQQHSPAHGALPSSSTTNKNTTSDSSSGFPLSPSSSFINLNVENNNNNNNNNNGNNSPDNSQSNLDHLQAESHEVGKPLFNPYQNV